MPLRGIILLMNIFDFLFADPVLNLFYGIYQLTGDVGWAIVLVSISFRLIMWPFSKDSYVRGQKARQLQPQIKKVREKYQGDFLGMQQALKELYDQNGVKPSLSGLIIFIQLPLYFALSSLVREVTSKEQIDGLYQWIYGQSSVPAGDIDPMAFSGLSQQFGWNLNIANQGGVVWGLAALTMVLSFVMAKFIFSKKPLEPEEDPAQQEVVEVKLADQKDEQAGAEQPENQLEKSASEKEKDQEAKPEALFDTEMFNRTMRLQFTYFMPILSFVFNIQFSLGLNIYFLTGTIVILLQQIVLRKFFDPTSNDSS